LDAAARRHQVSWEWIKGHSGHAVQEVADDTARRIAQAGRVDADLLDEAALQLTGK
jgi:ribonuclease HI